MNGKQLAVIVLATIFLTYCIQDTEASFKLKKLLKAGLLIKALSPNKIILPIPIPIPIGVHQEHHHGGHNFHHGGFHGGHGFDYGHGGHGYDYGHGGYHVHSTGYHLSHGW